jgi:hypothetical protein
MMDKEQAVGLVLGTLIVSIAGSGFGYYYAISQAQHGQICSLLNDGEYSAEIGMLGYTRPSSNFEYWSNLSASYNALSALERC